MDRMRQVYESNTGSPTTPSPPMMSPLRGHARSGSVGVSNMQKTQTKSAAQRLAQVMLHQPADEDEDILLDYSSSAPGRSIGLAGGRPLQSGAPLIKPTTKRSVNVVGNQQSTEDDDKSDSSTSGRRTISSHAKRSVNLVGNQQSAEDDDKNNSSTSGRRTISSHANGSNMQSRSSTNKAVAQRHAHATIHQWTDEDIGEDDFSLDYGLVSGLGSMGRARGRATQSRSPMMKAPGQKPLMVMSQQRGDEEASGITLSNINISENATGVVRRPSVRAVHSHSSMSKGAPAQANHLDHKEDVQDQLSEGYTLAFGTTSIVHTGKVSMQSPPCMSVRTQQEQTPLASGARSPLFVNSVEQSLSARSPSANQLLQTINSVDQPLSARSAMPGQSPHPSHCTEQPPSARALSGIRMHIPIKTVPIVPATASLRSTNSGTPSESYADNRRDKRLSMDFGSMNNLRESSNQHSNSALQDELDMLQEENESLLEKLRFAEERLEEAEARAQQLEKQIITLGEGVTLEERLLSRKEAVLQQREAAMRAAAQTHGGNLAEIDALRAEAEFAREEATSAMEHFHEAEVKANSLLTMTQRLILTQEEMEEVVLKRCWLSRYWSLCVRHGILSEIAGARFEYWSSLAPFPLEAVLAVGQKSKDNTTLMSNGEEERESCLLYSDKISADGSVESMVLVERGLRELALLKVEDALVFAMAQHRRPRALKFGPSDEVKLPSEGQYESFELSQEESEDLRFKQAWLTYFWRRAKSHGLESDLAEERLEYWINHSSRSSTSHDAVDVERGLLELRKLGIENQLWRESRNGVEFNPKAPSDTYF